MTAADIDAPAVDDAGESEAAPASSPYLTRLELAARLRVQKSTLDKWAVDGKGPRFFKFGGIVRYRLSDVIAWEEAQTSKATA